MLTILASSQTGMHARQMLERKPPQWASIRSSSTSLLVLRRPTSGLDSSSATISSIGRPLTPPMPLMRSTAICTPTSAVLPPAAPAPDSGLIAPTLYGFAWPNAARHGAGTSINAPIAPPPQPTTRRRVTLPLYQKSCAQTSSFHFSVIAHVLPLDLSVHEKHTRARKRGRGRRIAGSRKTTRRNGALVG